MRVSWFLCCCCCLALLALVHCASAEPITVGAVISAIYTAASVAITILGATFILIKVAVYYGLAIAIFIFFVENFFTAFNFALKFSLSSWLLNLLLRTLACEPPDPTNMNVDPASFIPA